MPGKNTIHPILRDISRYDDLLSINNELLRLAALEEADPLMVHSLMGDFIQAMDELAGQRLYVMTGKAAALMDTTIIELFKRPAIAEVISELYFQSFQAPIQLVYCIAVDSIEEIQAQGYSNELRDSLVTRGVENLIAHDAFRTDADHHLMESVIISTLMYTDNHQPALDCCAAIISSTKESPSGIDVIFTALRRLHPPGSDATTAACPLLQWMKMNEDSLVKQMGRSKPAPWMANELAEIFHTNDMHGLADHWYLRASYLDFQRLYEIHQRSGLKPDEAYLDQFLADDVKPSLKHVMDLLMYSLSVENVLKGAKNLKFKQLPWVTKSLVGAFSTFETMGITPLSPSECEPLISSLSEHLKSGESMEALMTKHIQPYIALSNSFKTKMFGIDLGL